MSQSGTYGNGGTPTPGSVVQTLTGNVGGPVGPDLLNNINLIGAGDILVTGIPLSNELQISLSGAISNSFVTDSGTAVPVAGVLNILGGTGINTVGSGDTVTINLDTPVSIANGGTNATSMTNTFGVNYFDGTRIVTTTVGTATQILTSNGVGLAPTFQNAPAAGVTSITGDVGGAVSGAVTLTGGTSGIVFTGSLGTTLTITSLGTTDHQVQVGNASGTLTGLTVGTNGQVLLGSTGANPVFANLTSTGGTIIYTTGAGTLNLEASGATASSFPTDAGTATPVLGVLNILGGVGIGTTGVGDTVTANLDVPVTIANGGTNATSMTHTDGVVYYDGTILNTTTVGTANQVLTSNGVGLAPTFQTLSSIPLGTTDHAVQVGNASGTLTSLTVGTNGQVLLGSTGANPVFANLTSTGSSITYTTGAGALNIDLTSPVSIAHGGTNATSMATTDGTIYYDGTRLVTTATGTAGQILTSNGAGVAPTYQTLAASGVTSITGDSGGAQTGAITLTGGTSGAVFAGAAGTITESFNFLSMTDTNAGGTTGYIAIGGSKVLAAYGGIANNNILVGEGAGRAAMTAIRVVGVGSGSLVAVTSGNDTVAIGTNALAALTSAENNIGIGTSALLSTTTGSGANVSVGNASMSSLTTGSQNCVLGNSALTHLLTGTSNIVLGSLAGDNYTTSESNNIVIGNAGVVGTSGVIRIGTSGTHTTCNISGITGVTVGATNGPVFIDNTGKLGTVGSSGTTNHAVQVGNSTGGFTSLTVGTNGQVLLGSTGADPVFATLTSTGGTISYTTGAGTLNLEAAGGGVTSITGNSGGALTGALTLTGGTSGATFAGSGTTLTESFTFLAMSDTNAGGTTGYISIGGSKVLACYGGVAGKNIFLGEAAGLTSLSGTENTCLGNIAGGALTSGASNTGVGSQALQLINSGSFNTAIGRNALNVVTTSNSNTACGYAALDNVATGTRNIGIGFSAGTSYATADSHNICIGNSGTGGESNVLRIGTNGSGTGQQNKCFIAGIAGVTVSSSAAVLINTSTGQLGTVASSRRYKEDIHDMGPESHDIMNLRPVSFVFKDKKEMGRQYGLIAEEVQEALPYLVIYNQDGEPDSVRYHELPILLLKEIQRLEARIQSLEEQFAARIR